jgi:hypothetical protein
MQPMKSCDRNPEARVWPQIELEGFQSLAAARALLKVRFSPRDQERMSALSAKARVGALSTDEQAEMDGYEQLGCLLDILNSKARRALKRHMPVL